MIPDSTQMIMTCSVISAFLFNRYRTHLNCRPKHRPMRLRATDRVEIRSENPFKTGCLSCGIVYDASCSITLTKRLVAILSDDFATSPRREERFPTALPLPWPRSSWCLRCIRGRAVIRDSSRVERSTESQRAERGKVLKARSEVRQSRHDSLRRIAV